MKVSGGGMEKKLAEFRRPLTVGEVAERAGVAVSTLHFYEAEGLITSWRNRGTAAVCAGGVRRVAVIKVAQRTGIPLKEIREALATLPEKRTPTTADWKKLSARWRVQLNDRIERLTRLRDQLDGCIGCGCLSVDSCPLRNPGDVRAKRGRERGCWKCRGRGKQRTGAGNKGTRERDERGRFKGDYGIWAMEGIARRTAGGFEWDARELDSRVLGDLPMEWKRGIGGTDGSEGGGGLGRSGRRADSANASDLMPAIV